MSAGLIVGLLDTSAAIGNELVAKSCRGLTAAWLRYGYEDDLIEGTSVDQILQQAIERECRYCFVQAYGCVIAERWQLDARQHRDFFQFLRAWVRQHDFFVVGQILSANGAGLGLATKAVLVDLKVYQQLGTPSFEAPAQGTCSIPRPRVRCEGDRIVELLPSQEPAESVAAGPAGEVIRRGLEAGYSIVGFDAALDAQLLDLEPTMAERREALTAVLGDGIVAYDPMSSKFSPDQHAFLGVVQRQASQARHGVFLWNIEAYDDIEQPESDFRSPVSSLYSVAAGFKPCRMLATHGFNEQTRVVYFDYSQRALDVRKFITEQWSGEDFPALVEELFRRFPHPDTFYQLWDDVTPETVQPNDILRIWDRELERWGGAECFTAFWQKYRRLPHEYICCNLLTDPAPLLDRVSAETGSLIWWSNAFFTMYGNWFYTSEERQQAYQRFVAGMNAANPELFVFGSDFNNTNVNGIRVAEYWDGYRRSGVDVTHPYKAYRTAVRM